MAGCRNCLAALLASLLLIICVSEQRVVDNDTATRLYDGADGRLSLPRPISGHFYDLFKYSQNVANDVKVLVNRPNFLNEISFQVTDRQDIKDAGSSYRLVKRDVEDTGSSSNTFSRPELLPSSEGVDGNPLSTGVEQKQIKIDSPVEGSEMHEQLEKEEQVEKEVSNGVVEVEGPDSSVAVLRHFSWLSAFMCDGRGPVWLAMNLVLLVVTVGAGLLAVFRLLALRSCSSLLSRTLYLMVMLLCFTAAAFTSVHLIHLSFGGQEGLPTVLTLLLTHTPVLCLSTALTLTLHRILQAVRLPWPVTTAGMGRVCCFLIALSVAGDLAVSWIQSTVVLLVTRVILTALSLLPLLAFMLRYRYVKQVWLVLHRELNGELKLMVQPPLQSSNQASTQAHLRDIVRPWAALLLTGSLMMSLLWCCNLSVSVFFALQTVSVWLWWLFHFLNTLLQVIVIILIIISCVITQNGPNAPVIIKVFLIPKDIFVSPSKRASPERNNFVYERVSYSCKPEAELHEPLNSYEMPPVQMPVRPRVNLQRSATFNYVPRASYPGYYGNPRVVYTNRAGSCTQINVPVNRTPVLPSPLAYQDASLVPVGIMGPHSLAVLNRNELPVQYSNTKFETCFPAGETEYHSLRRSLKRYDGDPHFNNSGVIGMPVLAPANFTSYSNSASCSWSMPVSPYHAVPLMPIPSSAAFQPVPVVSVLTQANIQRELPRPFEYFGNIQYETSKPLHEAKPFSFSSKIEVLPIDSISSSSQCLPNTPSSLQPLPENSESPSLHRNFLDSQKSPDRCEADQRTPLAIFVESAKMGRTEESEGQHGHEKSVGDTVREILHSAQKPVVRPRRTLSARQARRTVLDADSSYANSVTYTSSVIEEEEHELHADEKFSPYAEEMCLPAQLRRNNSTANCNYNRDRKNVVTTDDEGNKYSSFRLSQMRPKHNEGYGTWGGRRKSRNGAYSVESFYAKNKKSVQSLSDEDGRSRLSLAGLYSRLKTRKDSIHESELTNGEEEVSRVGESSLVAQDEESPINCGGDVVEDQTLSVDEEPVERSEIDLARDIFSSSTVLSDFYNVSKC